MDAFTLVAKLILDKSEFDAGLAEAENSAKGGGSGGKGITALGVAAGHMVAAGATAAAKAGVEAAKDVIRTGMAFDDVMATVRSVREMTEEQFDAVRGKALELGESTVFTATQVGEALYYMGVAGWDSQQMIAGISGILDLAAASGENLATSSDIVTDALTAFGMTAEETERFVDVLAAAASNSNTTVGMMGDAFKYVAPVAGALKYTVEDIAVGMGLMANNGVKASQSGTALRMILNGLIDPSDEAKKSLQKLGLSMYEADGRAKSFRQVMSDFRDAMRNNGFDPASSDAEKLQKSLNELNDAYESGSISAEEYATRQSALTNQLTNAEFMKAISDIVGVRGLPALLAIMKATDDEWDQLAKSIDNSEGTAARMAEERLNTLQGDITLLNSALDGLKLLMNDEYKNSIRDFIQGITEEIGKLSQAFNEGGLAGMFNNLAKWITDGITNTLKSADFAEGAGEFGKALGDFVGNLVQSLVSSGSELMSGLFQAGMNLAGGLIDGLFSGLFGTGNDSLGYFLDKAQEDQQEVIDKANATAVEAQGIVGYLQSLVDQYGEAASKTNEWADAMQRLQNLIPGVSDAMKQENQTMSEMLDNMNQYIEQMRQQTVQQARQATLQSYQNKYVESEIALQQNQEAYDQAQSAMASARQWAYDLMKQAAETGYNDGSGYLFPQMFNGDNARFQSPDDIDLGDNWFRAALGEAVDVLNKTGQNEEGYSSGGILDAYDKAATAAETSAGNMEQLADDAASLKTQMKIAEDAIGNMADSAEDTADETEDLNGIADEAGDLDLSGLQGAADGATSSLNSVASNAKVDFGAVNSSAAAVASAFSSLAARANSVSFGGIGGGGALSGSGPAPTVGGVGRFAKGAWEIPYDEYPAVLHRGEMVLTASQARKYRDGDVGDISADTLYQAVANAVQQAVASIQINMDGAAVGNAVTKQVSKNIYKDQYGRRYATV